MNIGVSRVRYGLPGLWFLVALCSAGLFFISFLPHPLSVDDGLRHVTMANILREQGIFAVPGWSTFLFQGFLHETAADPWFLTHVLLIPFTAVSPLFALKAFTLIQILFVGSAFLLLLKSFKTTSGETAFFLLLFFAGSFQFTGRLLIARPFGLQTGIAMIVLWAILERRALPIAVALALSTLISQLFVFPLFIAGAGFLWLFLTKERRSAWKVLLAALLGTSIGLILHPAPLEYLEYLRMAFLKIPFLNEEAKLSNEMQQDAVGALLSLLYLITLAMLAAVAGTSFRLQSILQDTKLIFIGILAVFFLGMQALWVRAVDFSWPLFVLFTALLTSHQREGITAMLQTLIPPVVRRWFLVLLVVQVSVIMMHFIRQNPENDMDAYRALRVLPSHVRVLNVDWNHFSPFFYVRPDLRYATGIDAAFAYLSDPAAHALILELGELEKADDRERTDRARAIMRELLRRWPSDYVAYVTAYHPNVTPAFAAMPELTLIVQEGKLSIFRVVAPPFNPSPATTSSSL